MNLPNNHDLLTSFTAFLVESGLSSVSIKNYLSDIRHFIRHLESRKVDDLQEVFQNITKYINSYVLEQKTLLTPTATTNRRLASVRRLATYLNVKYGIVNNESKLKTDHNVSPSVSSSSNLNNDSASDNSNISSKKILDQFRQHLISEKKSHSTVKNYLSDLYHYFAWIANQTPYNTNHLEQVLSNEELQNYITYQKLVHTSTSVINRRQSSIKQLTSYCFDQGFIPKNPFAVIVTEAKISRLAWFKRFSTKATKPQNASKNPLAIAYHKYNSLSFTPYFHLALLVIATTAMGILFYNQIIKSANPSLAATSLTPPKRQLSFQGRLLDSSGTPINVPMNVNFKLWDDLTAGAQLYTTGTCSVTPDQDGIFNSLIGDGVCGAEIPQSVFTDNRDVFLAVTVGAETLTPRQQIATVGYALNSETLQGYPASASATINTVPVVDNLGNITIAAASPSLVSTSGNFNIKGQALSLTTELNSGGDIVIQPDALASGQILAISGTTTEDSFRISNANLTTGTLISGYIGNDTATGSGNLITLSSGATESAKFWVTADGRTNIATATDSAITSAFIINQNGTGNIFSASSSGVSKFNIDNMGRLSIIDGVAHTIDDVTGNLTLTSNSNTINLNDNVSFAGTTTLNSIAYTWPAAIPSNNYVLQAQTDGTLAWVAQTGGTIVNQGWTWLAGVLYPTNTFDAINVGNAATASATVHLAGVAGDNSFINGGNFGIGDVSPSSLLSVGNGDLFQVNSSGIISSIDGVAHTIDDVTGNLTLTSNSSTVSINDDLTVSGTTGLTLSGAGADITLSGTGTHSISNSSAATDITIDAGTSGKVQIAATSTGDVELAGGSAGTGCTISNTTGNLTCSGTISGAAATTKWNGLTAPDNNLSLAHGAFTTAFTYDALTTGTALDLSSTSLTTGKLFNLSSTSTTLSTGGLATIDWSPGSATTATGDLFRINIGANGTSGNLFNITDNGTTLFSVSETAITSNIPTNFTSAGDVSMAYDLNFTNPTISNITSAAPLSITAGETFNSSNLTLKTYNSGDLVIDAAGGVTLNQAQAWDLANSSTTSLNFESGLFNIDTANSRIGIGTSAPNAKLDVVGEASISGTLTLGNGTTNVLQSPYGPLSLNYKSAANAWSAAMTIQDTTGNVGIGTTTPGGKLDVKIATNNRFTLFDSIGGFGYTGPLVDAIDESNTLIPLTFNASKFVFNTGNLGIGDTSPLATLTVGNGDLFQVAGATGSVTTAGDIAINGDDLTSDGTLGVLAATGLNLQATTGTITIDSIAASQIINLGNSDVARTINIGTGTGIDTLNIGTGATGADVINIGSANAGALTMRGGTNSLIDYPNFDVDTSGNITVANQGDIRLSEGSGGGSDYTGFQAPATLAASLLYTLPSTQGSADSTLTNNGSGTLSWFNPVGSTGTSGFWTRTATSLYPANVNDPVAIGFSTSPDINAMLEVDGDIYPHADYATGYNLGSSSLTWVGLFVTQIAGSTGTLRVDVENKDLEDGQWNVLTSLRVGDATKSMPTNMEFYVSGDASVSGTFGVTGTSYLTGTVTAQGDLNVFGTVNIGAGTGKLDVGVVDPPYTINGEKYATYMSGMVGVKEETAGILSTNEYVEGLGYKKTINFNSQAKGSDLWLFGKTTNIKENLSRLSVLLTPNTQTKTWYNIDENNNTLTIFSSAPTNISYRLTAPRFDDANWTNTRASGNDGYILNNPDISDNNIAIDENINYSVQIANIDGSYKIFSNNQEIKETSSYASSLIANLKAGIATVSEIVASNITTNKLVTPIANISELNAINATISGTLFADNIKSKAIDKLNEQLGLLDEKYSTASAILAALQNQYSEFSLNNPLELSPLATTSAVLPSDLTLNSLSAESIITHDLLANGSIFTPALSSFDTDLFIQPNGDKSVHILANLMTLYPDGKVVVNGDLIITGNIYANNIDTRTATVSGTLAVGNGELATNSDSILALFNDNGDVVGSVNASGSANFEQLTTGGLIIAAGNENISTISGQANSNSTIGIATIATGSSEIIINNTNVTDNTLVYITPISNTDNQVLFVKSKQSGTGFTVAVPQPVTKETSFNFWLVQTK